MKQDKIGASIDLNEGWKYEGKQKNKNLFRDNNYFINYKGEMFLIGGSSIDLPRFGDVWKTRDGVHWEKLIGKTPWDKGKGRINQQLQVYKNSIYLLGGDTGENDREIWKTANGVQWDRVGEIPYIKKVHSSYVYKNKLFIAGENVNGVYGVIEMQKNGSWIFTPVPYTLSRSFFVYNGILWNYYFHGIFNSKDGIHFKQIVSGPHYSDDFILHKGILYVEFEDMIATTDNGIDFTFLKSKERLTFEPETKLDNYYLNYDYFRVVNFKNKLWLIGPNSNYIFSSKDGLKWNKVKVKTGFAPREKFAIAVYKNKIFIAGGVQVQEREICGLKKQLYFVLNDVWSSSNGSKWKLERSHADWNNRSSHHLFVYKGNLTLIGGSTYGRNYYDMWVSNDGRDWKQKISDYTKLLKSGSIRPDFSNIINDNGTLIFFDSYVDDVSLKTSDGINWYEEDLSYDRPDMDKIVITINPKNNRKVYIAYEDYDKFWGSYDLKKWIRLQNAEFESFASSFSYKRIIIYKRKIYVIAVDFDNRTVKSSRCEIDWNEMVQ